MKSDVSFLRENEVQINKSMSYLVWLSCLAGPAISCGVIFGIFHDISVYAGIIMFILQVTLAVIQTCLITYIPYSKMIKHITFWGIEIIFIFLSYAHVNILLCYFLIPILTLFYCNRKLYLSYTLISYLVAILCAFLIAPSWESVLVNTTSTQWFLDTIAGYTIEFLVLLTAGYMINSISLEQIDIIYGDTVRIASTDKDRYTDALTGLWNKAYLRKSFEKYVTIQKHVSALIILDLDDFKQVNENYGHNEGDRALQYMANTIEETFRSSDQTVLCRYGGDEFVILLPYTDSEDAVIKCMQRLQRNLKKGDDTHDYLKTITFSSGIAFGIRNGFTLQDVFDHADSALYYIKNNGKNGFHIFQDDDELIHRNK